MATIELSLVVLAFTVLRAAVAANYTAALTNSDNLSSVLPQQFQDRMQNVTILPVQDAMEFGGRPVNAERVERQKRNALKKPNARWHKGIVPYALDRSIDKKRAGEIQAAIKEFSKYTCIRWVPRTKNHTDYVEFVYNITGPCNSVVGRTRGKQLIRLGKSCASTAAVIHEMMHALGFKHEHTRPDRDSHIIVQWKNMKNGTKKNNFEKLDSARVTTLDEPYDYNSIMHYQSSYFGKNGKATIVSTNPKIIKLGNNELSNLDIVKLRKYYKCAGDKSQVEDVKCPFNGKTYSDREEFTVGRYVLRCDVQRSAIAGVACIDSKGKRIKINGTFVHKQFVVKCTVNNNIIGKEFVGCIDAHGKQRQINETYVWTGNSFLYKCTKNDFCAIEQELVSCIDSKGKKRKINEKFVENGIKMQCKQQTQATIRRR